MKFILTHPRTAPVDELVQQLLNGREKQVSDLAVLDALLKILHESQIEAEFQLLNGNVVSSDLMYRLRCERGIDPLAIIE